MDWGRDTLLTGSRMEGRQVQVEAGRNLRLESLQDRESYDSRNTGGGFSVSAGGGHVSGSGSAQKQILRSDYESVTEQAGIYVGDQGFQIQVGGNTHLKGAVIHSDAPAEKNRLETGTLSWEDVENRASYKADGQGVAFSATTRTGQEDRRKLNERGLYPEVVSTVKGRAESTTKAGISAGSISIREGEKQVQPVKQLNRDTKNSLQKLATIFDKEKVQEKQELVNELSKVGNQIIHIYSNKMKLQEGSYEKLMAHSIFGGLLSSLAGGKITTGVLAGGINEYIIKYLIEVHGVQWVHNHPDTVQWISSAVGSAVGVINSESDISKNISLYGTRWNNMYDEDITEGEFKTKNDAYYAMYTNCDLELEQSQFDDYTVAEKMYILSTGLIHHAENIAAAEISSYIATQNDYTYVAASLFRHGLHGNGEAVYFPVGTAASNLIQSTPEFTEEILKLAEDVEPYSKKIYYTSIATSGKALYAFGHIKLAVEITNNGDGSFSVNGQARDVYNFEAFGSRRRGNIREILKSNTIAAMNDAAYELQRAGVLQPFIYDIQIDTLIRR